jgi:hypothetical protein
VLLLPGEYDLGLSPRNAAERAGLFEHAQLVMQPGTRRFPQLDDPVWFHADAGGLSRLIASSSSFVANVAPSVRILLAMAVARGSQRRSLIVRWGRTTLPRTAVYGDTVGPGHEPTDAAAERQVLHPLQQ